MRERIREFLLKNRASQEAVELSDEDSLLEQGVVDSVTMVDLIAFLESTFGIRVADDDMTPENFDSVSAIVTYTEAKMDGFQSSSGAPV